MKLVKLEVVRVAVPCGAGRRAMSPGADGDAYNMATAPLAEMESLMVRLTTDTGLVGWGEAFGHLSNVATFAALAGPVGRFFLGRSIGSDLSGIQSLREEAERAFHGFGRTGPFVFALSAIDTALWDIHAKAAGLPLFRLLGGVSGAIEVYASLVSYGNDPTEVDYQVRRTLAQGFRRIKLHESHVNAIAAAREAAGDAELMVDVNCLWPAEDAAEQIDALRELSLSWIEEPLWPPDDLDGLAALRGRGIPVAAGENASGVAGIREHLRRGAVDVLQPSVAKIGGVSAMRDVIELAGAANIPAVPHCFYYGAGMLATAHLVACLPAGTALEIPLLDWPRPLYPELALGNTLALSERPGLGYEPDPAVLAEYCRDSRTLEMSNAP